MAYGAEAVEVLGEQSLFGRTASQQPAPKRESEAIVSLEKAVSVERPEVVEV